MARARWSVSNQSRHCTPTGAAAQTAQPYPAYLLHGPFRVARALEPQAVRHGTHGVRVRPAALRLSVVGRQWELSSMQHTGHGCLANGQ